jgi:ATP-binding cassette subfamily B protein
MSAEMADALDPAAAGGGRPTSGQALAQSLEEAAERRAKSRNVGALRRLWPFIRAHWGDASLSLLFLLVSTSSTLGLSGAVRLLVDHLGTAERAHASAA